MKRRPETGKRHFSPDFTRGNRRSYGSFYLRN